MLASSSKHALNVCSRSNLHLRCSKSGPKWQQLLGPGCMVQRHAANSAPAFSRPRYPARDASRLMYESQKNGPVFRVNRGARTSEMNLKMREPLSRKRPDEVLELARQMKKENIRPDIHTYNAIISALSQDFCAEEAWTVYRDMLAMEIRPDINIFNQLLFGHRACHSNDFQKVLDEIEKQGLEPNAATYDTILRFHLDCDNLEMALFKLAEMNDMGFQPSLKVMQYLITEIGEVGHVRLALNLADAYEATAVRRLDSDTWVKLLVFCAEELYADGVLRCWKTVVEDLNIRPDQGLCQLVLDTAARHGLPTLAAEAIRELESIGVNFQEHHFTPMVDSFIKTEQIKEAFCVLDLMRAAQVNPTIDSAFSILQAIRHDPEAIDSAYTKLEEIHKEGQKVDVVAVNVLIKACGLLNDLQRAVGIYKAMPSLSVQPDAETYEMLLRACRATRHIELGERLFGEMQEAGIKPTAKTFEAFISLILTQTDYENAFFYLEEMKGAGHVPSYNVYEEIVKICVASQDSRHKLAVEELEQMGYKPSARLRNFIKTGGAEWVNQLSDDERLPHETRRRLKDAKMSREKAEVEQEASAPAS